uniref:Uncharacterized protein n=1 Tax=Arundo donax TaxID=35708 RepID=A0A0A8XY84_ARUDO
MYHVLSSEPAIDQNSKNPIIFMRFYSVKESIFSIFIWYIGTTYYRFYELNSS